MALSIKLFNPLHQKGRRLDILSESSSSSSDRHCRTSEDIFRFFFSQTSGRISPFRTDKRSERFDHVMGTIRRGERKDRGELTALYSKADIIKCDTVVPTRGVATVAVAASYPRGMVKAYQPSERHSPSITVCRPCCSFRRPARLPSRHRASRIQFAHG